MCGWVKRSWEGISNEIIIESFKSCGISNDLDDVEDSDKEIINISDDNSEGDISNDNLDDDISVDDNVSSINE